jgi:hypothetical protein
MRKEERERSCERTSQKPDSPALVQVSDHQRQFGDTVLPRSAARRTREWQGRETAAQKVSQFSESRMNRSRTPYTGRLLYILKDPVRLRFDLPKFQEPPLKLLYVQPIVVDVAV